MDIHSTHIFVVQGNNTGTAYILLRTITLASCNRTTYIHIHIQKTSVHTLAYGHKYIMYNLKHMCTSECVYMCMCVRVCVCIPFWSYTVDRNDTGFLSFHALAYNVSDCSTVLSCLFFNWDMICFGYSFLLLRTVPMASMPTSCRYLNRGMDV
jgi:hypothetical protein